MTSLRLVVSKKLPHAVQSYKTRARAGSQHWERSWSQTAATGSRAGSLELEPKIWERTRFFGSQNSRLPTLAAEWQATYNCLELILTLSSSSSLNPFLIVSDSLASPRLRIGHTFLTHNHLSTQLRSLFCPHCDTELPLSVEHIFQCPKLSPLCDSLRIPHDCITALSGTSPPLSNISLFLHLTGFLSAI